MSGFLRTEKDTRLHIYIMLENNITYNCHCIRSSAHDDCEIKEDQCGYKDTKGLLTVSHFTAEDEGNYQCTVTHGNVTLRSIRQVLLGGES